VGEKFLSALTLIRLPAMPHEAVQKVT